jgi:hypothetical protein
MDFGPINGPGTTIPWSLLRTGTPPIHPVALDDCLTLSRPLRIAIIVTTFAKTIQYGVALIAT